MKKLIFAILFLTILLFTFGVDAACCETTKNNVKCQDTNDVSICAGDLLPSSCSNVDSCKVGCCVDNEEGTCALNSLQASCSLGVWEDDANCNVRECRQGCCILPTQGESWYMAETRCEKLSTFYGIRKDFKQVDETACIKLQKNQDEGACLYSLGGEIGCRFTTKQDCLKITNNVNNFYNQTLCSNPALATSCEKQARTSCVVGRSEVYWFDSCGNRENIYSSDKDASWNNGIVLRKENSCNVNSSNIESKECGNCNSNLGSFCALDSLTSTSATFGDYMCKDMNCLYKGKTYLDGETWCDYESYIGDGKDVVGSRNLKKICDKGIVKTEPCEDYRQEICVEKTVDNKKEAQCRINKWRECLNVNAIGNDENEEEEMSWDEINSLKERRCLQNPDCDFRVMNIFDAPEGRDNETDTAVRMCTPKYPPGLDFSSALRESNGEMCNAGNFDCTVVFFCGKCVQNCNCLAKEFTETLNDACMSMGDCGASANIEGEVTSGGYGLLFEDEVLEGEESKPPRLSEEYLANLKIYATPVAGQKALEFLNGTKEQIILLGLDLVGIGVGGVGGQAKPGKGWWMWLVDYSLWPVSWYWGGWGTGAEDCKVKEKVVSFECNPWKAPLGGEDCEKCDDEVENGIPCSKYRCASLGAGCEFVNAGSGNEDCVWKNRNDASPPKINLTDLSSELKFEGKDEDRARIIMNNDECLESFSGNLVNVQTDELALCKFDFFDNLFDDLDNYIGDFYSFDHNLSLNFPSRGSLAWELNLTGDESNINEINEMLDNMTRDMQMHIKCRDRNGNEKPYQIRTCVSDTDTHEPQMVTSIPAQDGYFPYNVAQIPLDIWMNEPVDCRISDEDEEYYEMDEEMDCRNSLIDIQRFGWKCNSTLNDDKAYYVRCLDQPWKSINRNANSESFVFSLGKSLTPLIVSRTSPSGNMVFGNSNITITLEATTSGGATGEAICSYSFDNSEDATYYNFFNNNGRQHSQIFNSIGEGSYSIRIRCRDVAGNIAEEVAGFSIEVDDGSPSITRAYKRNNNLNIVTEEDSSCYYSFFGCEFDYTNASVMSGISKIHTTPWNSGNIYYIKCRDIWGNGPLGCSMVAKPENIPEG